MIVNICDIYIDVL